VIGKTGWRQFNLCNQFAVLESVVTFRSISRKPVEIGNGNNAPAIIFTKSRRGSPLWSMSFNRAFSSSESGASAFGSGVSGSFMAVDSW
jgi:hypothetical protein